MNHPVATDPDYLRLLADDAHDEIRQWIFGADPERHDHFGDMPETSTGLAQRALSSRVPAATAERLACPTPHGGSRPAVAARAHHELEGHR